MTEILEHLTFVKASSSAKVKHLAEQGLKHNLYVNRSWWELKRALKKALTDTNCFIVLAYHDNTPVAIGHYCYNNENVNFYVKPSYRRMGIGTILANEIKKECVNMIGNIGVIGSEKFFEKLNICF
jgi:GNAT superfamily N-acetyltransferase